MPKKSEATAAYKSHPKRYQGPPERELDTTPLELPLGSCRPTPLHELIANMVRQAVSEERGEEIESFEDADDFEEEDPDTLDLSAYELTELQEEMTMEQWQAQQEAEADPTPHPDEVLGDAPDPNEPEPDKP